MAVNKRDLNTLTGETGWPVVNYAQEERNFQTSHNGRAGALSIPRFKFTFLVEFQFSPRALDNPVTNLKEFVTDTGKLYTHLVSIDHPNTTIKTEKLRSYNKWINVPTQVEYAQAAMTFHDDSTSVVQAFWKEHLNFYTHQATIGDRIAGNNNHSNLGSSQEVNAFQFTDDLVAVGGGEMRSNMGTRPSLGMRLKPNDGRHFLESIVIYDLGTEPDAINIYWYHRPMVTAWNHDNLDKEDRTGNVRVTANFDYEGYYFSIGQNRGRMADYIQHILGAFPEGGLNAPRKNGIARDGREEVVNRPVELTEGIVSPSDIRSARQARASQAEMEALLRTAVVEPALESELGPVIPNSLGGKQLDLDKTRAEKAALLDDAPAGISANRDRIDKLTAREDALVEAIKDQKAEQRAANFVGEPERSALANTEAASGISGAPPSSIGPRPGRAVILDVGAIETEAENLSNTASQLSSVADAQTRIADENQLIADGAAARGDNELARSAQVTADETRALAGANQREADAAQAAADKQYAAADNARALNNRNSTNAQK